MDLRLMIAFKPRNFEHSRLFLMFGQLRIRSCKKEIPPLCLHTSFTEYLKHKQAASKHNLFLLFKGRILDRIFGLAHAQFGSKTPTFSYLNDIT